MRSEYSNSSSSSVGNFSVDSHSYSEGRIDKAPVISIGVFDEPAGFNTTANSASTSTFSHISSSALSDYSKPSKPSKPSISIEEVKEVPIRSEAADIRSDMSTMLLSLPTISHSELE